LTARRRGPALGRAGEITPAALWFQALPGVISGKAVMTPRPALTGDGR
jgi:hypothetical protein